MPRKNQPESVGLSATQTIPELEQSKAAVLNTLASQHSRRTYEYAIERFIAWYCSEPRLTFNRSVVVKYRAFLERLSLSAATINLHLSAIRRLADESAESGWLSPEHAIGIRRFKGVKRLGRKMGNWLTRNQAQELVNAASKTNLCGWRDGAMLGLLLGCGLRRSEVVGLNLDQLQSREGRWVIVNLVGKGKRLRTIPVPSWSKELLDAWLRHSGVIEGKVFRRVLKEGTRQEAGVTANVVWYAVDYRTIVQLRILESTGVALFLTPVSVLAFSQLKSGKNDAAASLYGLFRNLGSAIGISVVNTMLVRRVEVHRTYLVQNLTDSSPQLAAAIHARRSFLQTFAGNSRADAAIRALALLNGEMNRQATVLTYMDCFRVLMWVSVTLSPVALLFAMQVSPKPTTNNRIEQMTTPK